MLKRVDVISLFPEMFSALEYGVTGKALKNGWVEFGVTNPRDFTSDRHRTVDDRPYGGGPGMLMKVQPLRDAILSVKARYQASGAGSDKTSCRQKVIYLSPQGEPVAQEAVKQLVECEHLILLAGRYEGIDERLIEHYVDHEYSIGDYVLSGGELPAMVLIDAVLRWVPGVLGHDESAKADSFNNGLLDYPHYTRPENLAGLAVPPVLLSGNHKQIEQWRMKQALGRTWLRRPDLLNNVELDDASRELLDEFIHEQEI